jgi:hypothetical protein
MRKFSILIVWSAAVLLLATLCGCQNGTNAKPYDFIDGVVKTDDVVVKDATLAVPLGLLPVKDATTLYTGDEAFVVLGLPILEATAQSSAAPVLDPAAVTWAVYTADKNILVSDLTILHTVISNGVAAQIKAARAIRAATPPK